MIHPRAMLLTVIRPTLRSMPPVMRGVRAEAALLANALQESGLRERVQIGGPARGLYQFEAIGVRGVLDHPATFDHAQDACEAWLYQVSRGADGHALQTTVEQLHRIIRDNDVLATIFARLALWRLPDQLAEADQPEAGWGQYVEAWRPGKPHRDRWDDSWRTAWQAVREAV
jgi:hypothetical protein